MTEIWFWSHILEILKSNGYKGRILERNEQNSWIKKEWLERR